MELGLYYIELGDIVGLILASIITYYFTIDSLTNIMYFL